jgi:hypothetical protein
MSSSSGPASAPPFGGWHLATGLLQSINVLTALDAFFTEHQ